MSRNRTGLCHNQERQQGISLPNHFQIKRRARPNFQRRGSGVGAGVRTAGGLELAVRGATPEDGGPELAGTSAERGAFGSGEAGGQSRASLTTPRICSNHQWARFKRPRLRPAGLSPGWFSKPNSNWRRIMVHLSLCRKTAQGELAGRQASIRPLSGRWAASRHSRMR